MPSRSANPFEKLFKVIPQLEKKRKSKIYCILHGGDQHICSPTFWSVVRKRKEFSNIDTLELLIHSPGGHPEISYQLMKFFRKNAKTVNVIVPIGAKSAATLMCLGADSIFMGEFSELGPLDTQIEDPIEKGARPVSPIDDFKSMEFLREYAVEILDYFTLTFVKRYGISLKDALQHSGTCMGGLVSKLYEKIDPLEVGGHRRSLAIGEEYAKRLLGIVKNPNQKSIIQKLVWEYPSHDFAIDYDEALELGLPVKRLDLAQDALLVEAVLEVMKHEVPFYGFVPQPKPKPKAAAKKAAKPTVVARKRAVQAAVGVNVSAAS